MFKQYSDNRCIHWAKMGDVCHQCDLNYANSLLKDAVKIIAALEQAVGTALDEAVGTKAADWKIINDAGCDASALRKKINKYIGSIKNGNV